MSTTKINNEQKHLFKDLLNKMENNIRARGTQPAPVLLGDSPSGSDGLPIWSEFPDPGVVDPRPDFMEALLISSNLRHRIAFTQSLNLVSKFSPEAIRGLLQAHKEIRHINQIAQFIDPLANYDPNDPSVKAVLSPIGLLHMYRQFFFETESFVGPSVANIWLSPGSTVEMVEVSTRSERTEREVETVEESSTFYEKTVKDYDELSKIQKVENLSDMSIGVTTSAGTDLGVFQADASGSLSLASSVNKSNETAHKNTREHTERIATELRRSVKTSFLDALPKLPIFQVEGMCFKTQLTGLSTTCYAGNTE